MNMKPCMRLIHYQSLGLYYSECQVERKNKIITTLFVYIMFNVTNIIFYTEKKYFSYLFLANMLCDTNEIVLKIINNTLNCFLFRKICTFYVSLKY